jgi:TfoX/Sxy family transcriptional regulator of competence genes
MPLNDETDPQFDRIAMAYKDTPGVSTGKMFGAVGLKVNGKVFAMVVKGRLVVKLPKARVDALVRDRRAQRFDPGHGRPMKEWVSVPRGALPWLAVVREAYEFVERGGR